MSDSSSTSPVAAEKPAIPAPLAEYLNGIVPLTVAQTTFNFSRTSFFRFRRDHGIKTLSGERLILADIVRAFEAERFPDREARGGGDTTNALVADYHTKIMLFEKAAAVFGFSRTDFWRFRKRHGIRRLSGGQVHTDDIIAGFEAERRGQPNKAA